MSQRSRQQHTSSSNNPESAHEPKGAAGRPRNHGVPTETRKDPLWWESQPTGFITTVHNYQIWDGECLILNMFTKQRARAKRLSREHYSKELYVLLGELDHQLFIYF